MRQPSLLLALGALAALAASPAHAQRRPLPRQAGLNITLQNGDYTCPAGQALLSIEEVQANQQAICQQLPTWHIARLADGGSMDGPGYGCTVHVIDHRQLGHSLCVQLRQQQRIRVRPGSFTAQTPRWTDHFRLTRDGRLQRDAGPPGRWQVVNGELIIDVPRRNGAQWRQWRLTRVARGQFRSRDGRLTLTRDARRPPADYLDPQAVLGVFRISRAGRRDGEYNFLGNGVFQSLGRGRAARQGHGGHWHLDGPRLILFWNRGDQTQLQYDARSQSFSQIGGAMRIVRGRGQVAPPVQQPPVVQPQPVPPRPVVPRQGILDPRAMPGQYDAIDPRWREVITLFANGTFQLRNGQQGRWRTTGAVLILDWPDGHRDQLALQPDQTFRGGGFVLRRRGRPAVPYLR